MMSHRPVSYRPWISTLCLAVGLLALPSASLAADLDTSDTYTWSAELVDFDEEKQMVTVKAMLVGSEMDTEQKFDAGDRILLTWSGINRATGVRYLSHGPVELENARMTMPVEFVAFDEDRRYVTFRTEIPEGDIDALRSLESGAWVTATAPFEAKQGDTATLSIRPYTAIG